MIQESTSLKYEPVSVPQVHYVDEEVTLIEGEGEGEPVAKRLKAMEDGAASRHALLRGNLSRVKQVSSAGPRSLISPDRTPSPLKLSALDETPTRVDVSGQQMPSPRRW